jgi:CheY-like chemotaxis protein/PAS domain-containing protein
MSINWNNHIDRLRSQIADLRSTLRVIKTKAHDERPGLEQTTAQLRELVDRDESQKTLYQFPKILHKILHNPAVGAIILGPNGEHLLFNTAAERLLGSDLMADALAEKSGNFGFYQTDKITKYTKEQLPWQQAVLGEEVPEVDLFVRRQGYVDGLWIKATSTALKSDTNAIGGAVVFLVDITEQVQVENQIQSTCEALEQQISQIGSAQLELQLLTEKLGKLDYLPEATPDTVSLQSSKKTSSDIPQPSPETSVAGSSDASAVIDYASDELAKWSDIETSTDATDSNDANSKSSNNDSTKPVPDGVDSATLTVASASETASQTTMSEEQQDFAATDTNADSQPQALSQADIQTLEEKAKQVNESIVQKLTSEIFAIANQIEPGVDSSGQQEFFAPDSNEKQSIAQVTPVQPVSDQPTDAADATDLNVPAVTAPHEPDKHSKSSKKTTKQTESDASTAKRRKILIVDDIPVNQKLLRLQLKRLGFECEAANNGDAAQKAVTTGDFALVLMDLDMPIMDGFESTAAIRKNEQGQGKRIPIVAMTSYDRQEDRERCLAAGMDDFLSKGATQKQLHEVVERCIKAASKEQPKAPAAPIEPLKETGLDIESLQKQFDK